MEFDDKRMNEIMVEVVKEFDYKNIDEEYGELKLNDIKYYVLPTKVIDDLTKVWRETIIRYLKEL